MKFNHILFLVISGAAIISCAPNKVATHHLSIPVQRPINVLVTGPSNTATLRVSTGSMTGCYNSNNGCMVFAQNKTGKVTFTMSGNDAGFHFTELKICEGTAPPTPLSKDCPLESANALDFYIKDTDGNLRIPNTKTGKIEWTYADNVKTFVLNDRNLLIQKYYYMLTACNAASHCPQADPILDNKGIY